jgi:hypothetical protein
VPFGWKQLVVAAGSTLGSRDFTILFEHRVFVRSFLFLFFYNISNRFRAMKVFSPGDFQRCFSFSTPGLQLIWSFSGDYCPQNIGDVRCDGSFSDKI